MATRRKAHLLSVVNRTTKTLGCTRDGIPYRLHPGYMAIDSENRVVQLEDHRVPKGIRIVPAKAIRDRRGHVTGFVPDLEAGDDAMPYFEQFEWAVARAACLQNKRNGTENQMDPREFESLCGVLEWDNDVEHCEQADGEMFDQSSLPENARRRLKVGNDLRRRPKNRRRFNIEAYGGGIGNPTGMHVPNHPGR